jgi:hypothetical protein
MFYVSPALTAVMLAMVPPVSLGVVCHTVHIRHSPFYDVLMQVFYGRYLKRLSNQTQEALGEMTKVSIPASTL